MADTYLVFGDLHGRILPAFSLAKRYAKDFGVPLAGLLQVGDLGYFPDLSRLDRATQRFAEKDPTELGAQDIIQVNSLADSVFDDPDCPEYLWFTAGNHEDHELLLDYSRTSGRHSDFAVDAYGRVRCIKDGFVVALPNQLRVGALWGVDGDGPNRRTNLPAWAYISSRNANRLLADSFQVLLCHDSPTHAIRMGYGSEVIDDVIGLMEPAFVFFGHYHGAGCRIEKYVGKTQVYHMNGFELGGHSGHAESGSVGALTWEGSHGSFEYLDPDWLKTFTRHNWRWL